MRMLSNFIPANIDNPLRLAARLARSESKSARYSMALAAMGLAAIPLDLLLYLAEQNLYRRSSLPDRPLIFIVGPPRSGTTLAYQLLVGQFEVAYLNNLTAVFPRSPITAMRIFDQRLSPYKSDYVSFYGRSTGLSAPNDGLYVWDRWFPRGDYTAVSQLDAQQQRSVRQFWGALSDSTGKPVVNKNNAMVAVAHLVAELLPNASFLCLTREPFFLAQSLLRARLDIHGTATRPYGLNDSRREDEDPIRSACSQVAFHRGLMQQAQSRIGKKRFHVVSYESICDQPAAFLDQLSEELPDLGRPIDRLPKKSFPSSNVLRVDKDTAVRIETSL